MILLFASRFDGNPNFHATHSGPRIEFLGVTFEKIRRFGRSAGGLKSGSREPLIDGIQSFVHLRNMFAVGKNSIFLCRDGCDTEFAGKNWRAGDLDAHQVVDTNRTERIEAQAISYVAYLSLGLADVRRKALP